METADEIVDFLNNQIGMEISNKFGKDANPVDIAKEVLRVQKDEGLWVVNKDKEGNAASISRNKISQKQYDNGFKQLNALDENGFNEKDREDLQKSK